MIPSHRSGKWPIISGPRSSLAERGWLAARLRGMVTVVIDTEPERFAASLGDAYLDAKAAGRL